MRKRLLLSTALISAVFPLAACSSEYDKCHNDAVNEMADQQKARAEQGGSNSVKGYFNEQQSYADAKCAGLSD